MTTVIRNDKHTHKKKPHMHFFEVSLPMRRSLLLAPHLILTQRVSRFWHTQAGLLRRC